MKYADTYGVVGDGVTDCTQPLRDALLAARTSGLKGEALVLPAGTMKITDMLSLEIAGNFRSVRLYGEGKQTSVIAAAFEANKPVFWRGGAFSPIEIYIKGVGVYCADDKATAFSISDVGRMHLEDLWIWGGRVGMWLTRCYAVSITDTIVKRTAHSGISLLEKTANNARLEGIGIYDCGEAVGAGGLVVGAADNFVLNASEIAGCHFGLHFGGPITSAQLLGNYIEGNVRNWYMSHPLKSVGMRGNWFGQTTEPTVFENVDKINVEENAFWNCAHSKAVSCTNYTQSKNTLLGSATLPN